MQNQSCTGKATPDKFLSMWIVPQRFSPRLFEPLQTTRIHGLNEIRTLNLAGPLRNQVPPYHGAYPR